MEINEINNSLLAEILPSGHKQKNKCIIKIQTNIWSDQKGLHIKKSLTFLRRKCEGFNILEEDTSAIGASEVIPRILNLDETKDGIYEVVMCNASHDYETGYIDDYDYELKPTDLKTKQ